MKTYNATIVQTSIGKIAVLESSGFITQLVFENEIEPRIAKLGEDVDFQETPVLTEAKRQLLAYLNQELQTFDLPLKPVGTAFMKKVWSALQEIPYGETVAYKDIAIKIEHPKAYRAVGLANNRNPIPVIIPCHRVIGAQGQLVGYGGGLAIKEYLLKLEEVMGCQTTEDVL